MGGRLGSPHAVDVPFVFGNLDAKGVESYTGAAGIEGLCRTPCKTPGLRLLGSATPVTADCPNGQRTCPRPATLVIDTTPTVQRDPMPEECAIWGDVPFDGVHPAIERSLPSTWEIFGTFLKARNRP